MADGDSRGGASAWPVRGAIDLWQIALDAGPSDGLSAQESDRAARFATEDLRLRWSRSRRGLRRVLAHYLGLAPLAVRFAPGDGKPALDNVPRQPDLQFNLSHSSNLAVCAVTTGAEIGVDVEASGSGLEADKLAGRVMCRSERAEYHRLSPADRNAMFLHVWTMKEALSKAIGVGLALPFDEVDIGYAPAGCIVNWNGIFWDVRQVPALPDYVCAVALGTPITTTRLFDARTLG